MTKSKNKNVLGRGLGNLLGAPTEEPLLGAASIQELPIDKIIPNKDQPRKLFDDESLEELAASLRSLGLVQPITVQALPSGQYMIISGERRWRAAALAGLTTLPAYIRTTGEDEVLELALIENIQREDLNAIEVALAYQQILDLHHLKQEELAARVGKKRATVSNYLRLLRLPAEIQLGLTQRLIDMARAIADQPSGDEPSATPARPRRATERKDFRLLEQHLSQVFSSSVTLRCSASGKGKLTIPFASDEELERIMQLLERVQH